MGIPLYTLCQPYFIDKLGSEWERREGSTAGMGRREEEMKVLVAFQTLSLGIYMTSMISGRDISSLG
jgi:hypothetical protein